MENKRTIVNKKDENGAYLPVKEEVSPSNLNLDTLIYEGLTCIYGIIRAVKTDVGTGIPSREAVMNLKDCMTMLHELKKKQQELLDSASDENLEEVLREGS